MGERSQKCDQGRVGSSSSQSRASVIKSISSSIQEQKSLEWVDELLAEETKKQEAISDFTSDTWAKIVTSELTMADVDKKIQQVEEELFGPKPKQAREKKSTKVKEVQEEVEEEDEEEDEDGSEPRYFTFDLGRLDDHLVDLLKLLDSVSYPGGKPMPDSTTTKSMYTSTKNNINRLGLQVILNRVAIVFEYKNIKPTRDFPTPSVKVNVTSEVKSNIWDKLKTMKMNDALRTIAQRTDGIFGKELGIITGSLLTYPRHAILMLEGPEISLVDFFTQFYKSSLMQRVTRGKVLFIMPQVLIRYLDEWSELEAVPPELDYELTSLSDVVQIQKLTKFFGNKCGNLWKYLRKNKLTGIGRTSDNIPDKLLPEEILIDLTLENKSLRSLQVWLQELTTLEFHDDPTDQAWPENDFTLPETSFKSDQYVESIGITVKSKNPPPENLEELDKFLTANVKLYQEEKEPEEVKDEKSETVEKRKESKKTDEAVGKIKMKSSAAAWKTKKKKQTK